jgi:tripartite-type tricarboxylate transporter receptor subunit TctC
MDMRQLRYFVRMVASGSLAKASRQVHARLAFFIASAAFAFAACAADQFPSRPVRVVVPFGPGGVGDLTARIVAQKMSEPLGKQVIVDNRPSAGGVIAAEVVAKAEPDGHTLLLLNNQQAVSVALFKSLPYDPVRDFQPVSPLATFSLVLLVAPNSPFKSVKDLVAQAKATPGKLNVSTINVGSTQNLAAELFKTMAGINVVIIPYTSSGAVFTALRGNDAQLSVEVLGAVIGQVKAGALRAVAVTSASRSPHLPNVPTVSEAGVPGYLATSWNGFAAPAKTPRARVDKLHQATASALASADVKKRFDELTVEPFSGTPESFSAHLKAEIAKWKKVIDDAKIPKQ